MPENEIWRDIEDFPRYRVSNFGYIFNDNTGKPVTRSSNAYDELTVGLMRDGKQYRRAVRGIVARAFVQGETSLFNTPIILDGIRTNLHAENLAWRPRWFAWKYTQQFSEDESWWYAGPVMDIKTGRVHDNIFEAAIYTGSLFTDVRRSLLNGTRVFPEGGIFEFT